MNIIKLVLPAFFLLLIINGINASTFDDGITMDSSLEYRSQDLHCLAMNVYHESRSENLAGKYAVADVVLNRVRDDRYPSDVCSVVYQGETKPSWKDPTILVPVRNRCQFSWYCDGKGDTATEVDAWEESVYVAYRMLHVGKFRGITEGATHYHTTYVNPYWAPSLQQVGTIVSHIFYRQD
jgi:N-acetylmuramoyl-L-alanine amidase